MVSKAITLLDMIKIVYNKSKHIQFESIVLLTDNMLLALRINNLIYKENLLVIDAEAEITEIKDLINEAIINIVVQWTKGHLHIKNPFQDNSTPYLITICHCEAEAFQNSVNSQRNRTNLRYMGKYTIQKN